MAEIRNARLKKEKLCLKRLEIKYDYVFLNDDQEIIVKFRDDNFGEAKCSIILSEKYPFMIPYVKFEFENENNYLLIDHKNYISFDFYYKPKWTCTLTLDQIILEIHKYVLKNYKCVKQDISSFVKSFLVLSEYYLNKTQIFILILIFTLIKFLVGFDQFSVLNYFDRNSEVVRKYVSNLSVSEWYSPQIKYNNLDLKMNMPPLAGYFYYIVGKLNLFFFSQIEKNLMNEKENSIYNSFLNLLFIFFELFFIYGILININESKKLNSIMKNIIFFIIIISPPILMINNQDFLIMIISLGFILYASFFYLKDRIYIGTIFLICGINFNILSLYYILAFIPFYLGRTLFFQKYHSKFRYSILVSFIINGFITISLIFLIWYPWISSRNILNGIYSIFSNSSEINVLSQLPTFWNLTKSFIKWSDYISFEFQSLISVFIVSFFSFPSMLAVIIFQNSKIFKLCLFNISLSIFLFSFNSSENTFILPLIFLLLNFKSFKLYSIDFNLIVSMNFYYNSNFENNKYQSIIICLFYYYLSTKFVNFLIESDYFKYNDTNENNTFSNYFILKKKINILKIQNIIENFLQNFDTNYEKIYRLLIHAIIIIINISIHIFESRNLLIFLFNCFSFLFYSVLLLRSNLILVQYFSKTYIKLKNRDKKQN